MVERYKSSKHAYNLTTVFYRSMWCLPELRQTGSDNLFQPNFDSEIITIPLHNITDVSFKATAYHQGPFSFACFWLVPKQTKAILPK